MASRKRKVDEAELNSSADDPADGGPQSDDIDLDEALADIDPEILELLEQREAEIGDEGVLGDAELKRIILSFEKKINKNQEMRLKYPDKPDKFMESEVDLDEEIRKLHVLSTAPHFYPDLVRLNVVKDLLSLLSHENTDISCETVELLKELTAPDAVLELEEGMVLVDELIRADGLSSLVSNMNRMDSSINDDEKAVFNTLEIFENLIEFRDDVAEKLVASTNIMPYLLKRITKKPLPNITVNVRLYVTEILDILLQKSTENRRILGELNGIEQILVTLSAYKNRMDPGSLEEEEMVENLFNCLCSCLMYPANKALFLADQGLELLLLFLKEKKFFRRSALKALDFGLSRSPAACMRWVELQGIKRIFTVLMNRGHMKGKKAGDAGEDMEHVVSCICSLLLHASGDSQMRVVAKFLEKEYEKVDRLVEIHEFQMKKLAHLMDKTGETPEEAELIYLEKLEKGLFTLQLVDFIIAFVCTQSAGVRSHLRLLLHQQSIPFLQLQQILSEYVEKMGVDTESTSNEGINPQKLKAHISNVVEHFNIVMERRVDGEVEKDE